MLIHRSYSSVMVLNCYLIEITIRLACPGQCMSELVDDFPPKFLSIYDTQNVCTFSRNIIVAHIAHIIISLLWRTLSYNSKRIRWLYFPEMLVTIVTFGYVIPCFNHSLPYDNLFIRFRLLSSGIRQKIKAIAYCNCSTN